MKWCAASRSGPPSANKMAWCSPVRAATPTGQDAILPASVIALGEPVGVSNFCPSSRRA